MIPYLKVFHLTIEMWRGGCNSEGWKVQDDVSAGFSASLNSLDITKAGMGKRDLLLVDQVDNEDVAGAAHRVLIKTGNGHLHAPENGFTTLVPRFRDAIAALIQLTQFELPPHRVVRPSQVVQVYYGFGDASDKQFGATISRDYNCKARLAKATKPSTGVQFQIGLWIAEEEEESSNYKELKNLVDTVKEEAEAGRLRNCKFFLFTDNSTAKSCFYQGTLKSRHLHGRVLKLRGLEMAYGMSIHVIHVSGKRMITQGTDGCSRGLLMEGVMTGQDMLLFVDLSRTAIERHPPVLDWVRSWTEMPNLEALTPEGWYEEGHGITGGKLGGHNVWIPEHELKNKLHLWTPQPLVVDAALEELLKARHK